MKRLTICLTAVMLLAGCQTWTASPNGSPSGNCSATNPGTVERCYAVAQSGDIVQLRDGIYQHIVIPAGNKPVIFVGNPDDPTTVKVRELDTDADNVAFVGIDFDGNFAKNAVVENDGTALFKDDRIGNVTDDKALLSGSDAVGARYENVYFHDVRITNDQVHNEAVYSQTPNVEFVNNVFERISTFDILFTRGDWWNQPYYCCGKVVGNRFMHTLRSLNPDDWYYVEFGWHGSALPDVVDWTVKNNFIETRATGDSTSPAVGGIGDIGGSWQGGVRCGNRETPGVNQVDDVWKTPC